jgi:hypothetical protein
MKYLSRLQNILLRQILMVFLIASMFLGFISYGNTIAVAQADVKTPEGIYYKGTPDSTNDSIRNDRQVKNAQSNLKGAVDNVREKLNLDEPIPQSTKRFFKSAERRTERTVEPLVKTPEGYYQAPPQAR